MGSAPETPYHKHNAILQSQSFMVQSSLVVSILLQQKKQPKIGLTQHSLGRNHAGTWPPLLLWTSPSLPRMTPALGTPALGTPAQPF